MDSGDINFLYTLSEGYSPEDRYGIKLAKMIGIPVSICEKSEEICEIIERNHLLKIKDNNEIRKEKTEFSLSHKLLSLKFSTLDFKSLKDLLKDLQNGE